MSMYYLGETSLFIWNVQVADWRWQLDADEPAPLAIDDLIETAALAIGALTALDALAPLEDEAGANTPPASPEPRKGVTTPLAAESARSGRGRGHWFLAGTKTLWGSTMLYDPIHALTRQQAVQDDIEADRRRGELDHLAARRGQSAFGQQRQLERKLELPVNKVAATVTRD